MYSSVIRGVTKNKTITSLTLCLNFPDNISIPPLPDGVIEQLLKDNNTLQALSLDIPDELLPSSLNILEVNTPLTAVDVWSSELMTSLLTHINGLHCLILPDPYPPHLLFLSHPSLHTLTLPLDTAESAIELFTILQTNTTLETLNMDIEEEEVYTSSVGTSLQDMLSQNQTLKYLTFTMCRRIIFSSFLSFLTNGLKSNTSLQHLSVPLPLNEDVKTFINCISQKNNLTEIEIFFKLDWPYVNSDKKKQELRSLFYEQVLPAVTNMLQSHSTIRLLNIDCLGVFINFVGESQPTWIELAQHLYETIFIHPSLEYVELQNNTLLRVVLYSQMKSLIDRHKEQQPHKPLPIVHISNTGLRNDDEDSTNGLQYSIASYRQFQLNVATDPPSFML